MKKSSTSGHKTTSMTPAKKARGIERAQPGAQEAPAPSPSAAKLIAARIKELRDADNGAAWRGEVLARVRNIITEADARVMEEWKWDVPVWSSADGTGIVCTGETYKAVVKLTFAKGAALPDPAGLFNSSLEGKTRRAIDIREGEKIDERALRALVRAALDLNATGNKRRTETQGRTGRVPSRPRATTSQPRTGAGTATPILLAGGNPQIAKGEGDGPVQAYIEAMPGWKREVGSRLDALVGRTVPASVLRKAVKWNSPFYGVDGAGWFLSAHCFTKYVKVAFFRGALLRPMPPEESKSGETRYLNIRENEWGTTLDEKQLAEWVRQASRLPGWDGK